MKEKGMKARLFELFKEFDPVIQEIVSDVLEVEQEYLSMKTPRGAKEKVRDILDRVVRDETG